MWTKSRFMGNHGLREIRYKAPLKNNTYESKKKQNIMAIIKCRSAVMK